MEKDLRKIKEMQIVCKLLTLTAWKIYEIGVNLVDCKLSGK